MEEPFIEWTGNNLATVEMYCWTSLQNTKLGDDPNYFNKQICFTNHNQLWINNPLHDEQIKANKGDIIRYSPEAERFYIETKSK